MSDRRSHYGAPNLLHFMLVETSAKTLLEQLRLVVDGNPQQVKNIEMVEYYITQFFVESGVKKKRETGLPTFSGAAKVSQAPRSTRTSILMSGGGTKVPLHQASVEVEIIEFLSQEASGSGRKKTKDRKRARMSLWPLLRSKIGASTHQHDIENPVVSDDDEDYFESLEEVEEEADDANNTPSFPKNDSSSSNRKDSSYKVNKKIAVLSIETAEDSVSTAISPIPASSALTLPPSIKNKIKNSNDHPSNPVGPRPPLESTAAEETSDAMPENDDVSSLLPISTMSGPPASATYLQPPGPFPSLRPTLMDQLSNVVNVRAPLQPRFMWDRKDAGSGEKASAGSDASCSVNHRATTEVSHFSAVDALLQQATSTWFTFSPHNIFKVYWDFFMIFTVIYIAVLLPIRLAFDVHVSGFEKGLDVTLDLFFIGDIILNFMAGYIDPATKDVVMDWHRIARRYASSWLLLDIVSSVPTDVIDAARGDWESSSGPLKMLKLMKVFRMLRVVRMHSFQTLEMSGRANPNVIRIFKFVAAFCFSLHFSACAYWAVAKWEGLGETGWVPAVEFDGSAFGDQYIKSIHYAFAAMMVNDMKPESPTELWFSCCIMLLGLVVNATIIGSAASLLSNLNAGAVEKKRQLDGVRGYMSFRKVPASLQKRITEYYEYLWDCGQNSHNEQLFDDLPQALLMHLRLSLSRELINNISMFQALDPSVVLALVLRMEASITIPDEVIIREGEVGHCMYFINRGAVQVSIKKPGSRGKKVEIATLKKGSYFGEIALMDAAHERTATVTSVTYCELYSLDQESWSEIVEYGSNGFFEALRSTAHDRYRELTNFKKNQKKNRGMFMSEDDKRDANKGGGGRRPPANRQGKGIIAKLQRGTSSSQDDTGSTGAVFDAAVKAAEEAENDSGSGALVSPQTPKNGKKVGMGGSYHGFGSGGSGSGGIINSNSGSSRLGKQNKSH